MQLIKIIIIAILVRDSKIGEIQNYPGAVPLKSCVFASACTSVRRGWWGSSLAPLQPNMDRQLLSSHSASAGLAGNVKNTEPRPKCPYSYKEKACTTSIFECLQIKTMSYTIALGSF